MMSGTAVAQRHGATAAEDGEKNAAAQPPHDDDEAAHPPRALPPIDSPAGRPMDPRAAQLQIAGSLTARSRAARLHVARRSATHALLEKTHSSTGMFGREHAPAAGEEEPELLPAFRGRNWHGMTPDQKPTLFGWVIYFVLCGGAAVAFLLCKSPFVYSTFRLFPVVLAGCCFRSWQTFKLSRPEPVHKRSAENA